jgi:hypothetical protein
MVLVYVDDIITIGYNIKKNRKIKMQLRQQFDIKDLNILKYFWTLK